MVWQVRFSIEETPDVSICKSFFWLFSVLQSVSFNLSTSCGRTLAGRVLGTKEGGTVGFTILYVGFQYGVSPPFFIVKTDPDDELTGFSWSWGGVQDSCCPGKGRASQKLPLSYFPVIPAFPAYPPSPVTSNISSSAKSLEDS